MRLLNRMQHFFKPTWTKVVYAGIFTVSPYFLAFILVGLPNGNSWGDIFFWLIALEPLWFIEQFLPHVYFVDQLLSRYVPDDLRNNEFFLHYVDPLLIFLLWYFIMCLVTFFITKKKKQKKGLKKSTH